MAGKRSVINVTDFSGGYSSNLPDERMPVNMVRTGENVYWEDGLRKRKGWSAYGETWPAPIDFIFGSMRAYMNSNWVHISSYSLTATPTVIHFATDDVTAKTFVEIDSGFTFSTSVEAADRFRFAIMKINGEDAVIGVDKEAIEKPFVIYYDSGYKIENLETYDTIDRINDDWYAGQYDASETHKYLDKTEEAQSSTADDFPLTSAGNNDGFYVAGILTFTKVLIASASQFNAATGVLYQYYKGDDVWGSLSMVTTPSWTAATGDRTLEFNYPQDWVAWDVDDGDNDEAYDSDDNMVTGTLSGRYVIRITFPTAPSAAQTADQLTLYHTQYLTQIMAGDIPHQAHVHNSRLFLAAGSNVNYSPYGKITGWSVRDTESFIKGGDRIQKMVSYRGLLLLIKGACLYALIGTSSDNWVVKVMDETIGSDYASSVAVVNQTVFFIGSDGYVYGFNGDVAKRISKHVHDDITTLLATKTPYAIHFQGNFYLTLGSTIFRFDPDTVREDDLGDGVVSFWKYTSEVSGITNLDYPVYFNGDQDSNILVVQNDNEFIQLETSNYKDVYSGDTNIAIEVKTKDLSFGQFGTKKNYSRIKPEVEKAGNWTFSLLSNHGDASIEVTMASGTGPGQYTEDVSVPYTIDGKDLTLKFQNTSAVFAAIYGFALDIARRVF